MQSKRSSAERDLLILRTLISGAVRKGYLFKQGGSHSRWKKRWFILKGNELFYFESSQESKMMGKFIIDTNTKVAELNEKKTKKDFCFTLDGPTFKKQRVLAAENDKQRKEWIQLIETTAKESQQYQSLKEGFLSKQAPNRLNWKKRYVLLKPKQIHYFKQQKDPIPVGVIELTECVEVNVSPDIKPFSFYVEHPNRRFYFFAENQLEVNSWVELITKVMGIEKKISPRKSILQIAREVFLGKPIKEGILNKPKQHDQIKKTKPVRLVLTHNFVYYFPQPNSTAKYHSMHLEDVQVETIPSSIEKIPFSFRIINLLYSLYVGAEDEQEYNAWLRVIDAAQKNIAFKPESQTDKEIKTIKNIDYTVEIVAEKIDKNAKTLSSAKVYDLKVNAFWTSWIVPKTWEQILKLYVQLWDEYPETIFPEFPEEPVYVSEGTESKDRRSGKSPIFADLQIDEIGSRSTKAQPSIIPFSKLPKTFDKDCDIKLMKCFIREILRNSDISQSSFIIQFLEMQDIFNAVNHGEISFVRYFLLQKVDVNVLNSQGTHSPLHLAAVKGFKLIVETLVVEAGSNVNFPNKKGQTPLFSAIEGGNRDIVNFLIEKGGDISTQDENGTSLLHVAAEKGHTELIKLLVEKGASISVQDTGSRTPLHYAAIEGQISAGELLIELGANVELQDEEGFTPLMTACWKTREEFVKMLLSKNAKVDVLDKNKRTCVHLAVLRKSETILGLLIKAKASLNEISGNHFFVMTVVTGSGVAPIHIASSKGYDSVIEFLVMNDAIINLLEENTKQTALHIAVLGNKLNVVEILLKAGGQSIINLQDAEGKTPLHCAASTDNLAAALLLLKLGAQLDVQDSNGSTPLHVACMKGGTEIVKELISNRATVNIRQKDESLPLHIAAAKGFEEIVGVLIFARSEINAKDSQGNTPLHLALMNKFSKIAVKIRENGGSLSMMNLAGNPPLFYVKDKTLQSQLQSIDSRSSMGL